MNEARTRLSSRRCLLLVVGVLALRFASVGVAQSAAADEVPVFRQPFTLKLGVDREHYYEQKFENLPYVWKGDVYLVVGDSFGVDLVTEDGRVTGVTYQPDLAKADLQFRLTQEKANDGLMMMLKTENKTKETIYIDGLMTIPGKKGIFPTNLLPVGPGLSSFESWPHPIVQLVLRGIRTAKAEPPAPARAGGL